MTPAELSSAVRAAVAASVEADELTVAVPEHATVERPKNRAHGDYATNVALQLAKPAGRAPRAVAEVLASRLRTLDGIANVQVAGPGFLNITLDTAAQGEIARTVVSQGDTFGRTEVLAGERLNLEFVSANPTGPLHLGHVRWAAVGDALARLLEAAGAAVTREYYVNDAGVQIDGYAASLLAAARGLATPEGGYGGDYIADIAAQIVRRNPGLLDGPDEPALQVFRHEGLELMLAEIQSGLADFGVRFDVYRHQQQLLDEGELDAALERLRAAGHVDDRDGAVWLRTSDFGDDKDRVLIKRDGSWTYFAADCAYYLDKRQRGFDRCIYTLGSDHHGYVGRLRALAACFGDDPDRTLEFLIGQMVNLYKGGKPFRMSKRAGTFVTLEDLVGAIGGDAGRYALARFSTDSTIDLDLDLWARRSNDNPVFYVQYVHARNASVLRHAADLGIALPDSSRVDVTLLSHERERELLLALGEFPRVVASAAELREPHRVARYLEEGVAPAYHRWYDACRVLPLGDEEATPLTSARLLLCEATRVVVANGLGLLGVSAPDRM